MLTAKKQNPTHYHTCSCGDPNCTEGLTAEMQETVTTFMDTYDALCEEEARLRQIQAWVDANVVPSAAMWRETFPEMPAGLETVLVDISMTAHLQSAKSMVTRATIEYERAYAAFTSIGGMVSTETRADGPIH